MLLIKVVSTGNYPNDIMINDQTLVRWGTIYLDRTSPDLEELRDRGIITFEAICGTVCIPGTNQSPNSNRNIPGTNNAQPAGPLQIGTSVVGATDWKCKSSSRYN